MISLGLRVGLYTSCALFAVLLVAATSNAFLVSELFRWLGEHSIIPFFNDSHTHSEARASITVDKHKSWSFQVWSQWTLTLVAALATFGIRKFGGPKQRKRNAAHLSSVAEPLIPEHGPAGGSTTFVSVAKRILNYQLPPRPFLLEWCGGLTVSDAFVILAWLAINVFYVQQRVSRIIPVFEGFLKAGVLEGWSVPKVYLIAISGALGWAATFDILLMFYPVPRSSFLLWLLGTNFPAFVKYHRWLGHGTMWVLTLHGWGFYLFWLLQHEWLEGLAFEKYGTNMLSGTLSWVSGCALWLTSLEWVRRNYFEVFYSTHIVGFLGFMVFGFMHHQSLWSYTMPGFLLYCLDVMFRLCQHRQPVNVAKCEVSKDGTLVTLRFDTDPATPLKPITDLFFHVCGDIPLRMHVFTVTPVRGAKQIVAMVKGYGAWTRRLIACAAADGAVRVAADGPYGGFPDPGEWVHYKVLIIFAGGIGVTPIMGMVQDMQARWAAGAGPRKVHLILVAGTQTEMAVFDCDTINDARTVGWLDVQLYYTRRDAAPAALPEAAAAAQETATAAIEAVAAKQPTSPASPPQPESRPASDSAFDLAAVGNAAKPSAAGLRTVSAPRERETLPRYDFGLGHLALAHVLCFAGAAAASIGVWAAKRASEGHAAPLRDAMHGMIALAHVPANILGASPFGEGNDSGLPDWLVGLLLFLCASAGAMLLPAFITVPLHLLRARQLCKAEIEAASGGHGKAAPVDIVDASSDDSSLSPPPPKLAYTTGRPDIAAVLSAACVEHARERDIGVFAAGPEPMVKLVQKVSAAHNDRIGLLGRPYLDCSKHTWCM